MTMFRPASFAVMLLVAAPAFAQQRPSTAPQPLRGYLIVGGGASISTPQNALTLNAEVAENVTPNLQAYMSAGYYDNVMSQAARNQLAQVGATLTAVTGSTWVFEGRDRARSFTVGGKFLVPTGTAFRPYIGAGVGAINFRRTIREQSRGNITNAYLAQFGAADGIVDPSQTNTTKPMTEIAAGVGAAIQRAYIDIGYRYRKAYHGVSSSFDVSQVGVAVGLKF
jgi:opacity protein-like surface antigen